MKNRIKRITTMLVTALFSTVMYSQNKLEQLADGLDENITFGERIGRGLIHLVAIGFAVVAIIKLIGIFTSNQGGEDRVSKAGNWIFSLIAVAVGWFLVTQVFWNPGG